MLKKKSPKNWGLKIALSTREMKTCSYREKICFLLINNICLQKRKAPKNGARHNIFKKKEEDTKKSYLSR